MKWCLNRDKEAKSKRAIEDLRELGNRGSIYKPARPSQAIKSERLVKSVMDILTEDYINSFQVDVDNQRLRCLSSGNSVRDEFAESLHSIEEVGAEQHKEFLEKQIQSNISFHQPTERNKVLGFKGMVKKTSLKNGRKLVEVNKDILAKLFSISLKEDKQIDFERALKYPSSDVPLSLCSDNGTIRKIPKRDLSKQVLSLQNFSPKPVINSSASVLLLT